MAFVKLIAPRDPGELAFIRSLLDGNDIAYVIRNEHFGSLYSGVPSLACEVMVPDQELERAEILLSKLREGPAPNPDAG